MITLTKGSSLRLLATLGVDLTGKTVSFVFAPVNPVGLDSQGVTVDLSGGGQQTRTATIVDAPSGQVSYTLTPTDSAVAGEYRAQFTFDSVVYPATGWIDFSVADFVAPNSFSSLADFCEPVRAIMGDFRTPYKYADTAIASVVRSNIRMGTLPGYGITSNGLTVTPAVVSPRDLALIVHHSARTLLRPNMGGFSWKTRALSIRREGQTEFLWELNNIIYYMENPTQLATFQSFYAWVNSIAGINVWAMLTEMRVNGPIASVNLGTSGMQVNSVT